MPLYNMPPAEMTSRRHIAYLMPSIAVYDFAGLVYTGDHFILKGFCILTDND